MRLHFNTLTLETEESRGRAILLLRELEAPDKTRITGTCFSNEPILFR